jgi:hypothetical protein
MAELAARIENQFKKIAEMLARVMNMGDIIKTQLSDKEKMYAVRNTGKITVQIDAEPEKEITPDITSVTKTPSVSPPKIKSLEVHCGDFEDCSV